MENETIQQVNKQVTKLGAYEEAPKSFQVVLFHGNCSDGFSAAWVARRYCLHNCIAEPNCIPINHDGIYNFPEEVDGKDVLVVDLSFPHEKMMELKERAKSVFVIDHHVFAPERCEASGIPIIYDIDECGASLTWKVYFPNDEMPLFLKYIRAGDIWKWGELPSDTEVVTALHSYDSDFETWDRFMDDSKIKPMLGFVRYYENEGKSIQRKCHKSVVSAMSRATVVDLFDYKVPVANSADFVSQLGSELAKAYPECPFAAVYFDDQVTGMRHWSLRSVNGSDNDVSIVAKRFGGGGHKHAAGFSTKIPDNNIPRLEENA